MKPRLSLYQALMLTLVFLSLPYVRPIVEALLAESRLVSMYDFLEITVQSLPYFALLGLLLYERRKRKQMEAQHQRDLLTERIRSVEFWKDFYWEYGARLGLKNSERAGLRSGYQKGQDELRVRRERIRG